MSDRVTRADRHVSMVLEPNAVAVAPPRGDAEPTGPEGEWLRGTGRINGIGLYEYSDGTDTWNELRLPEFVFAEDTLRAWHMMPLTNDHPDVFVRRSNFKTLACGTLGSDVVQDGDHTRASWLAHDDAWIAAYRAGKRGLSCGYHCTIVPAHDPLIHELAKTVNGLTPAAGEGEDGKFHGRPFRYLQKDYTPNHVALCDMPRGEGCYADTVDVQWKPKGADAWSLRAVPTTTTKADDMNEQVIAQILAAIKAELPALIKAELAAAQQPAAPVAAPVAAAPAVVAPAATDSAAPKGTLDAVLASIQALTSKVQAREQADARAEHATVLAVAARRLPADAVKLLSGKSTLDVMRAVAANRFPDFAESIMHGDDGFVRGLYTAASAVPAPERSSTNDANEELMRAILSRDPSNRDDSFGNDFISRTIFAAMDVQ